MTNQKELEGRVADAASEVDFRSYNLEAIESGVLRDMLKAGYDPAEGEFSTSWSRTSYSRRPKPCRLIWP